MSFDAFAVGMAYGIKKVHIPWFSLVIICLLSVLFGYISVFFGKQLSLIFPVRIAQYIGSGILILTGGWFLIQNALPPKSVEKLTLAEIVIKPLGITVTVVRNPLSMDTDNSGTIDALEAVSVGIALAADVLSTGVGLGAASAAGYLLPPLIGVFEIIFIRLGDFSGVKLQRFHEKIKPVAATLPAAVMIAIGLFRLLIK